MSRRSTARPRLLVLATTVPAREGDGTPAFVLTLAQALADANDVTILTPRVPGGAAAERWGDVEVRRFPYFPKRFEGLAAGAIMPNLSAEPWRLAEVPPLLAAFLGAAVREVRRARPDVVHAHWLLPAGVLALALRRIFGIPYIVTGHGADVFGLNARPLRALKRQVIDKAAIVSATSAEMGDALGMSEDEKQRFVVPMGVDVDRIQQAVGEPAPEPGRFLFVGRLVEKKGVDTLLEAVKDVPEGRLVVVGDGPERSRLEARASQLGLLGRTQFLGQLGPARIADELRVAQALVVPSKVARDGDRDTTPLVMSEAMAAGVPVIASRLGGLADRIDSGVNGLLVAPDDAGELARALRQMFAHPDEATAWAAAGRRTAREHLDVRLAADRYQGFLAAAMGRAPGGGAMWPADPRADDDAREA